MSGRGLLRGPADLAAVVVVLAGCLFVAYAARGATFSGDEWTFILDRRGWSADVLLEPHNEHLSTLPVAAYQLLLAVFGAGSYAPYMALLLLLHAVACLLLYALARRHTGPVPALAAAAVLAMLGPAWQDLLWAFQIGYVGALAAGLGMALCLDGPPSRRRDVAASGLLAVSLLCSSVGLGMVVLGLVQLVLQRPFMARRLLVVAVPVALYALWYAGFGASTARADNIPGIPRYLWDALSAAFASVTGMAHTDDSPYLVSPRYGRLVAVAALAVAVVAIARGRRLPPVGWGALAAVTALWVAAGVAFFAAGREAAQSRYQYVAGAMILLAAATLVGPRRLGRRTGVVLAAVTVAVCASNLVMLDDRAAYWRSNSTYVKAELGALHVARALVRPDYLPENLFTTQAIGNHNLPVAAGDYFSATSSVGTPADGVAELMRRPEPVRQAVDVVLQGAERLAFAPTGPRSLRAAGCRRAADGAGIGELALRTGDLVVRVRRGTAATVQLRRFADGYRFVTLGDERPPFAQVRLRDGRPLRLRLPRDGAALPWHARIVGGRDVVACVR